MVVGFVAALSCILAAVLAAVVLTGKRRATSAPAPTTRQAKRAPAPRRTDRVVPQKTRFFELVLRQVPPDELRDLFGLSDRGLEPFQVMLETRARLASLTHRLYTIYQNELYVHLNEELRRAHAELQRALGPGFRYDRDAGEFGGDVGAGALRDALAVLQAHAAARAAEKR